MYLKSHMNLMSLTNLMNFRKVNSCQSNITSKGIKVKKSGMNQVFKYINTIWNALTSIEPSFQKYPEKNPEIMSIKKIKSKIQDRILKSMSKAALKGIVIPEIISATKINNERIFEIRPVGLMTKQHQSPLFSFSASWVSFFALLVVP